MVQKGFVPHPEVGYSCKCMTTTPWSSNFYKEPRTFWKKICRWLLVLVSGIFLLGWLMLGNTFAQEEKLPVSPQFDGQLWVEFTDAKKPGKTQSKVVDSSATTKLPFMGVSQRLYFYYGIKRKKAEDRLPGAIVIKVINLYDSGTEDIAETAKLTYLYRNSFPAKAKLEGDKEAIGRNWYTLYHKGEIANYFLRKRFHAVFPVDEKTDGSVERKNCFLFTAKEKWNPQIARQKTYLIYYKGVDEQGTWVDFDVVATKEMSEILISIIDLGQPGMGGLVENSWQISRDR